MHLAVAVGQAPPRVFLLPLIKLDSPERSQLPGQCGLDPRGSPLFGLRGGQVLVATYSVAFRVLKSTLGRDPECSLERGNFLSGESRVSEDHRGCVPCCTSCHNESYVQSSSVCCYNNHLARSMSYRLAVTYSQTGVRGVFRSLIRGLTNLRENIWSWRVLTPGTGVRALTPLVHCVCCLVCYSLQPSLELPSTSAPSQKP